MLCSWSALTEQILRLTLLGVRTKLCDHTYLDAQGVIGIRGYSYMLVNSTRILPLHCSLLLTVFSYVKLEYSSLVPIEHAVPEYTRPAYAPKFANRAE